MHLCSSHLFLNPLNISGVTEVKRTRSKQLSHIHLWTNMYIYNEGISPKTILLEGSNFLEKGQRVKKFHNEPKSIVYRLMLDITIIRHDRY